MNISDRDESTLGTERLQNPLLQMSRDEFIAYKLAEQPERPHYFRRMKNTTSRGLLFWMPAGYPLR
jgi:hydroxyacylglutathione hydrolase